jgi:starch synthase
VHVLFATAELAPIATVGGLANAAAGLVKELRRQGATVTLVLPEYGGVVLEGATSFELPVPGWAAPAWVRVGRHAELGELHLVWVPGMDRPHPYLQASGDGWPDNDRRFLAFSAAVASLYRRLAPDVLHLNDWHTATALAAFHDGEAPPSVLSIHNLAYQGTCDGEWLWHLGPRAGAYEWWGACNPFKGGLVLSDAIVAVSPRYAAELTTPEGGFGHDALLRHRGDALLGILNGIDADVWDPATDPHLVMPFDAADPAGKEACRDALHRRLGLPDGPGPLAVAVTRLTGQKGTDLLPDLLRFLPRLPLRLAVLGAGDRWTADALRAAASAHPERFAFVEGYDESLSHQLFAGGDLMLMPSRFEPCGLSQMQAMRYGTLPVVTDVGGLHDTVADADDHPAEGTGWVAARADPVDLVDALHRAVRGWADPTRRARAQANGMQRDWSWRQPAEGHLALYGQLLAGG